MPEPLEYATPVAPQRSSPGMFWTLFFVAGFVSSYVTDELAHWWVGKRSDGGGFIICLVLILPSALAFLIAKAGAGSRLRLSPFIGTAWGALGPPLGLAILLALDVI